MQVQMIGHASIFVETHDCKILMDPILFDPHAEGIEDICPKREVIIEKIPEFDLLIISHRHLDHFDIRSLAALPKNVDVLIPNDKLLKDCLTKLGYSNIYTLKDSDEVKIGSTRLLVTRSENRVPEYGILFADPSGVFWNQVDSVVSLDTINFVKSKYPQIDFLLAPWQPMLETNYQNNESLSFPYVEYNSLLEKISLIKPKAIAPGANGFKLVDGSAWLNQVVFPVSREQFCRDVAITCPEVKDNVFALDPGDILTFDRGEFSYMPERSTFVRKKDSDRAQLQFSPVNVGLSIVDKNTDNYDIDEMQAVIEQEINCELPKFIASNKNTPLVEYYRWQVVYQLEVIFPDCIRYWSLDFSQGDVEIKPEKNPLANFFTTITASSFYGFIKQFKGWDFANLGGNIRSYKKIYVATPMGIAVPHERQIANIFDLRFPLKEAFENARNYEVEQWQSATDKEERQNNKTVMIKLGNTYVRLVKDSQSKTNNDAKSSEAVELVSGG